MAKDEGTVEPATPAEAAALDEDDETRAEDGTPSWAIIPPETETKKLPPSRLITFMRFRAEWTDTPEKGDRQCIMWNLAVGDEKVATQRGGENYINVTSEMAKQMIRAVDGVWVDWSRPTVPPAGIDIFWNDIGKKCRNLVVNHFMRAHGLTNLEKFDFLSHCVAVRVARR